MAQEMREYIKSPFSVGEADRRTLDENHTVSNLTTAVNKAVQIHDLAEKKISAITLYCTSKISAILSTVTKILPQIYADMVVERTGYAF
jgi:hypothetical protein